MDLGGDSAHTHKKRHAITRRTTLSCIWVGAPHRWEAFFGSSIDAADDLSDTASQMYLRSRRATPSTPAAPSTVRRMASIRPGGEMPMARVEMPMARAAMPTARVTTHAGGENIASGVGSLELDKGLDENIVYKVDGLLRGFKRCLARNFPSASRSENDAPGDVRRRSFMRKLNHRRLIYPRLHGVSPNEWFSPPPLRARNLFP